MEIQEFVRSHIERKRKDVVLDVGELAQDVAAGSPLRILKPYVPRLRPADKQRFGGESLGELKSRRLVAIELVDGAEDVYITPSLTKPVGFSKF